MLRTYDFNYCIKNDWLGFERVLEIVNDKAGKGFYGAEISPKSTGELLKDLKKFVKADFIVLKTNDYEIKREAVDNAIVDILSHNELSEKKDTRNYRYGGIDHVIAKKCGQNNVSIMISFNDFLKAKDRGVILGRMKQNVRLCLKFKAPIIIASGAQKQEEAVPSDNLIAFAEFLGMNRNQAVKSVSFVAEKLLNRK